jgi:hypothetical protein
MEGFHDGRAERSPDDGLELHIRLFFIGLVIMLEPRSPMLRELGAPPPVFVLLHIEIEDDLGKDLPDPPHGLRRIDRIEAEEIQANDDG